jgi:hypothetical protein
LVAGLLAGCVSRTCTAPLDRVKVLAQEGRIAQYQPVRHPTVHNVARVTSRNAGFSRVARHIYRDGGWRAFWRGNGINCMKAGPELGIVFSMRVALLNAVNSFDDSRAARAAADREKAGQPAVPRARRSAAATFGINFVCSAASGAAAQCLLYPLETAKTRIAVASSGEYRGLWDCMHQSYMRGGVRDFYHGLGANLLGIVPYRGLEIGCFYAIDGAGRRRRTVAAMRAKADRAGGSGAMEDVHLTKQEQDATRLSVIEVAASGSLSSVVAQTVTYPLNVVRTRLQTQGVNGRPRIYNGMVHCFVSILRTDGYTGLFRGLGANYLKAIPASVLTFMVVDTCQRYWP